MPQNLSDNKNGRTVVAGLFSKLVVFRLLNSMEPEPSGLFTSPYSGNVETARKDPLWQLNAY
jgi:hypothetical protein